MSFSKQGKEIIGEIDGSQVYSKTLSKITELNPQHFIVETDHKQTEIFVTDTGLLSDGNTLDGIEVSIQSERERIIGRNFKEGIDGSRSPSTKGMILKAPMPGMVKTISVSVGDEVQKNTQVLVLEAMKMENSIMAGFAGTVSKIHIQAGVSVEKNMPMIEFR